MTRLFFGAATIALLAANPASAQLLGGGGQIGGGQIGSGLIGGGIGSTLGQTRASGDVLGRAGGSTRIDRSVRPRSGRVTASSQTSLSASALPTRGVAAASRRGLRQVSETAGGVPVFVSTRIAAPAVSVPQVAVQAYPAYDRTAYYVGPGVAYVPAGDVDVYMDSQYRDLERGVEGTGATVYRRGDDLVVQLPADVTFAFDRADIQPRFTRTLAAVARTLEDYRNTDVEIVGHTDAVGSDAYNLALSERRGRSVADFLVARDTEPHRLVVEAMGESEPIASNATISGRAANRRVEIVLHPRSA